MLFLFQNKRKKRKKKLKQSFQQVFKTLFSSFGIFSIILLLVVLIFSVKPFLKSLSNRDFSLLFAIAGDKLSSQGLFAEPIKNFVSDSPEMTFLQGNSLIAISSPATVSTYVLGSILETGESNLEEARDGVVEYLVEEGDTLSSVAEKFDISLDTILWANNLSSKSIIKPGQKILVLPVSGAVHLVKKGDSLGKIAQAYKADINDIVKFNNLSDEGDIFIGDILVVPGGKMPLKPSYIAAPSIPLGESYFIFPCEGKITQGPHGAFGNAIDIANKCGKPVVAAAGGKVQRTGYISIGGNRVTILHPNGVVTYYGHLSTITVVSGQTVSAGEIIGYIGNTGYTIGGTGCHVHFEVRGAANFLAKYAVGSTISWKK